LANYLGSYIDDGLTPFSVFVELEYLDVTVLRRGEGEVMVVVGRAPAC
jgi:hypothetical protein